MGRTYVITGAGSGIGRATKELLEAQGHTVVGVDLKGADIAADLGTKQGRIDAANAAAEAAGGSVDAVIACAGVTLPSPVTVMGTEDVCDSTSVPSGSCPVTLNT